MNKGGKWVYGWFTVGTAGEIEIPPAAYTEYGFQMGEQVLLLRGSRRSGGFSIGRLKKLKGMVGRLLGRSLGQSLILDDGRVIMPSKIDIQPGQRFLVDVAVGMQCSSSGMDPFTKKRCCGFINYQTMSYNQTL